MSASTAQSMSELSPSTSYLQNSIFLEVFQNMSTMCREETLVKAVSSGDEELVKTLIQLGVSLQVSEYNRFLHFRLRNPVTPVMIAADNNNLPCLQMLIKNGANVNTGDKYNVTALHLAAKKGHLDCLKTLLEAGANVNASTSCSQKMLIKAPHVKGTTPLHLAASNNNVECVKELMVYCVDYNAIDEKGVSPLYIAAKLGYDECVQVLLRNAVGHDILSLPGFVTGDTPLHFAVKLGMFGSVRELLNFGSDVNHKNHNGDTPLHICVKYCSSRTAFKILKLLVLYGHDCDVNLKDSKDFTPLHYLTFNRAFRRPDMANFLIGYGADINIGFSRSMTLLSYEYNSRNPETSIFATCVQSVRIPPCHRILRAYNFASAELTPNNRMALHAMRLMNFYGRDDENVHYEMQHYRHANTVDPRTIEKQTWYTNKIYEPIPRLMHQCRYVIRSHMGSKKLKFIKCLGIPTYIKSYLLLGADFETD